MASLREQGTGDVRWFGRSLAVGRGAGNDLVLPRATVSSRHAVIQWRGDAYYVRDLGSRNGTWVGDRRVGGWHPLAGGDTVGFGPDCRWTAEDVEPPGPLAPGVRLAVAEDGTGRVVGLLEDRVVFGSAAWHDVRVGGRGRGEDRPGSELLAVLAWEGASPCLVATAPETVWVAARPVAPGRSARLDAGARFTVGDAAFVLREVEGGATATTQPGAAPPRREYPYRLRLTRTAEDGEVRVEDGGREVLLVGHALKFDLLWALATALGPPAGGAGAVGLPPREPGWLDDAELCIALWGRGGADERASNRLAKLVSDTRALLGEHGIDGWFIEKRGGRTRLRLDSGAVERRP